MSQGLNGQYRDILNTYWQNQVTKLETEDHDYKLHQLPLARIKKVMKADPEVKMISAEAPILFAKGCDIFITELTMRAWIHAEENKRRTLQRSDIASALAKSDMFDFLIDIVPREDATTQHKRRPEYNAVGTYTVPDPSTATASSATMGVGPEQGQMGGQDFAGMEPQHMQPPPPQYQQQTGMYPPPAPQQQPYAGQPMFDPSMYGQPQAYSMGQIPQMPQVRPIRTFDAMSRTDDYRSSISQLLSNNNNHIRIWRHIGSRSKATSKTQTRKVNRTMGRKARIRACHILPPRVMTCLSSWRRQRKHSSSALLLHWAAEIGVQWAYQWQRGW